MSDPNAVNPAVSARAGWRGWRAVWGGAALSLSVLGAAGMAHAHGDLHERIERLDRLIAAEPQQVTWWLRRAELLRAHQQWAQAERDLAQARQLMPAADVARRDAPWRLSLAALRLDQGRPAQALALLEGQEGSGSTDGVGADAGRASEAAGQTMPAVWMRLRSQALEQLGRYGEATAQQAALVAELAEPDVADYLAWAALAAKAEGIAAGLGVLDAGLQRLGPLPVLQRQAVEWEVAQQHWPQALARLETMLQASARPEGLWLWRAQIETQAGWPEQAQRSLTQAEAALERVPPAQRSTPAMATLREQIDAQWRQVRPAP